MKKNLLLTAMVTLLGSTAVNAQVLKTYGGMTVIPGTQTNSGKSMLIAADYQETRAMGPRRESDYDEDDFENVVFSIYDTNMRKQTEFSISMPEIPYTYWRERAVTDVKIGDLVYEYSRNFYEYGNYSGEISISTAAELVEWLRNNYGSYYEYRTFVDNQGNVSAIINSYDYYWNYYPFGTAFPRDYFYVSNNVVYRCYVDYELNYDLLHTVEANWNNLNWQKVGENQTSSLSCSLAEYTVYDFDRVDGTFDMEDPVPLSQNLFNSDDKWEYVIVANEMYDVISDGYLFNEEGYLYFERTQSEMSGDSFDFMIVNQDGTVINKFDFEDELCDDDEFDVYRMGGKTYLKFTLHDKDGEHYEALYEYSSLGDGVKLVSKTRLKVAPSIVNRGESVKVDLGDSTSKLMVTNAAGQLLMQQNAQGNTSIDTHRLAKGIYNITVEEKGKPRKTERFIVK